MFILCGELVVVQEIPRTRPEGSCVQQIEISTSILL